MKKAILIGVLLAVALLSACVYENPNPSPASSFETEADTVTEEASDPASTSEEVTRPAETEPPVTSEFPNETDEGFSKRY